MVNDTTKSQTNLRNSFKYPNLYYKDFVLRDFNFLPNNKKLDFLENYGEFLFQVGFQRSDLNQKITTFASTSKGKIRGITRIYEAVNEIPFFLFFPIDHLDSIAKGLKKIDDDEFPMYVGAIQSKIFLDKILNTGEDHDQYFEWLKINDDRVASRVKWYCIETWECEGLVFAKKDSATGWTLFLNGHGEIVGSTLDIKDAEYAYNCNLLSRECWVDFTPRNLPGTGIGGSNNGTNSTDSSGGSGGNSGINGPGKTPPIHNLTYEEVKILKECIGENSTLNSLRFNVVKDTSSGGNTDMSYLMYQLCSKGNLSVENVIEKINNINEVNDFLENAQVIDPCTGKEINKSMLLQDLCSDGFNDINLEALLAPLATNLIQCTEITPCESELVKLHPGKAVISYINAKIAEQKTTEKFGYNGFLDCSDAFRPALWNALNSQHYGIDIAKLFSDAHECNMDGTPGSGNDVEMDLFNNNVGQIIGIFWPEAPLSVIIEQICGKLESGDLKISTGANSDPIDPNAPLVDSFGCECN